MSDSKEDKKNDNKGMDFPSRVIFISTCVYVGLVFLWVPSLNSRGDNPLSLNELGDYFAGSVSVVAFAWFMFSFFQQKEALEKHSNVLKEQGDKLNKTVEEMKRANDIAEDQKQIVMANEAHTRRDVFLQLQGLLVDDLNNQLIVIMERVMGGNFPICLEKYESGDKMAFFRAIENYFIHNNKLEGQSGVLKPIVLNSAKRYCRTYETLLEEVQKIDSENRVLKSLYEDNFIGYVYDRLKEEVKRLESKVLNNTNKKKSQFVEVMENETVE